MIKEYKTNQRPPVVAVVGHIDHGKSTLLDYIRGTNSAGQEPGGITQKIGAYEISHRDETGLEHRLTFLDTPGHEAFSATRALAAGVADIAVLVVSAEEGPKTQTAEALASIEEHHLPYLIAINKTDRPAANIERTKQQLAENNVFIEEYGGKVPAVMISAKTGQGVKELLGLLVLTAALMDLRGDPQKNASGFVIESRIDPKSGIRTTLVVKDGRLFIGDFLAVGSLIGKVRGLYNFLGQPEKIVAFSSPAQMEGFNDLPALGSTFFAFNTKREAEDHIAARPDETEATRLPAKGGRLNLPVLIKTGMLGTKEAVVREISKLGDEQIRPQIIGSRVGSVNENDVKAASVSSDRPIILGFQTEVERTAAAAAERLGVTIMTFDVIYKMSEWVKEELLRRRPVVTEEQAVGKAKILKVFRTEKDVQIIGGVINEGRVATGKNFKALRRGSEVGRGIIRELQQQKIGVKEIEAGKQFGAAVECKTTLEPDDWLEVFEVIQR